MAERNRDGLAMIKKDPELRRWAASLVRKAIEKGYFHTEDDEEAKRILDTILDENKP